jgi:hypothetical protein
MTTISEQKEFLLSSEPVARLTGGEFSKIEGITLKEQITAFFNSIGNTAKSVFGNIKEKILDYSSNPVRFNSQATNQGDVAKVLQNILSAK